MDFINIPFESLLHPLVRKIRPELDQIPQGEEMVREANYNQALSLAERAQLLVEGEQRLREDEESRRGWRIGQGVTAGALLAGATARGLESLGNLGESLDKARERSKIRLLKEALNEVSVKEPKILQMLAADAADAAGLKAPKNVSSLKHLLRGPLAAKHGNEEAAMAELGKLAKNRFKSVGFTEFTSPTMSKALRAVADENRSLWDQISRNASKTLQGAAKLGLRPGVRLGLAVGAMGLGGYLASRDLKEGDDVPVRSLAEATEYLREKDRLQALVRGTQMGPTRRVADLEGKAGVFPGVVGAVDPHKIEDTIGGMVRNIDAAGHMVDPGLGAKWMLLGEG